LGGEWDLRRRLRAPIYNVILENFTIRKVNNFLADIYPAGGGGGGGGGGVHEYIDTGTLFHSS
jgi:hypothetical protein